MDKLIVFLQNFVEKHPEMKDFNVFQSTLTVYCKEETVVFDF